MSSSPEAVSCASHAGFLSLLCDLFAVAPLPGVASSSDMGDGCCAVVMRLVTRIGLRFRLNLSLLCRKSAFFTGSCCVGVDVPELPAIFDVLGFADKRTDRLLGLVVFLPETAVSGAGEAVGRQRECTPLRPSQVLSDSTREDFAGSLLNSHHCVEAHFSHCL